MAKLSENIAIIRATRAKGLFEWWNRLHPSDKKTQRDMAEAMGILPETLNLKLNGHRALTEDDARKIASYFPGVRIEYVLGYDEFKTLSELQDHFTKNTDAINSACLTLLDSAVIEVCKRENIAPPVLDNIPELLLLEAQLRDYAVSLMWNYIKWRPASSVWGYLDQIEQNKQRNSDAIRGG